MLMIVINTVNAVEDHVEKEKFQLKNFKRN